MKTVECVPNFSEGRDERVLLAIKEAITSVEGVRFMDLDKGADTHRTVMTFIGTPEAVLEAAFRGIAKAAQLIDMRKHRGTHPRMGACDVCPFIPVHDVSMEECVQLAHKLGKRVGEELSIPVYLYEYAASHEERRNLATLRHGEYEALEEKLNARQLLPDFGPEIFDEGVKKTGATVIGARDFLIAYNINLNTLDKRHANDLAFALREKGRSKRVENTFPDYFRGKILRYRVDSQEYPCSICNHVSDSVDELQKHSQEHHQFDWRAFMKEHWDFEIDSTNPQALQGQAVKEPGLFSHCKAIGWVVESLGCAQVSINLTKPSQTPPHLVLEACRRLAYERGLVVTGSEVVGLIPFNVLYEAGQYYLSSQRSPRGLPIRDVLQTAIRSMGLSDLSPFVLEQKVLGLPSDIDKPLASSSLSDFCDEVSRPTVAPGGGSVSALAASLAAALHAMVCNLNVGRNEAAGYWEDFDRMGLEFQQLQAELMKIVDEDSGAFNGVIEARRLPAETLVEKEIRTRAIEEAYKHAIHTPLRCAELAYQCCLRAETIKFEILDDMISDFGVAVQLTQAAFTGAMYNVLVNLKAIKDKEYVAQIRKQLNDMHESVLKSTSVTQHSVLLMLKGEYFPN